MKTLDFLIPELDVILASSSQAFEQLKNKRILVTGGTGFIGKWLIKSFLHANETRSLNAELLILTRDSASFLTSWPEFKNEKSLKYVDGNLHELPPIGGPIHAIIHAASDASSQKARDSVSNSDLNDLGTQKLIELAIEKKISHFLFTSSGAVYGDQPMATASFKETDFPVAAVHSAYGESKRIAEKRLQKAAQDYGFHLSIARIFAVIGPWMPLTSSYAAGNFVQQATHEKPIVIQSDGQAQRNHIYVADLVIALWNLMFFGEDQAAYNIAGDQTVSILELATLIQEEAGSKGLITVEKSPGASVHRYLGNTEKLKKHLQWSPRWSLRNAAKRSVEWVKFMESSHD